MDRVTRGGELGWNVVAMDIIEAGLRSVAFFSSGMIWATFNRI